MRAECKTRLDPTAASPRFNLALALDRLALRQLAQRAWSEFSSVDEANGWASEVRSRRRREVDSLFQLRWATWKDRLLRGEQPSAVELEELVREYPHQLREISVEHLIPA